MRQFLALSLTLTLVGCAWFTDFKEQPKIDPWDPGARANPQGSIPINGSAAPELMYSRLAAMDAYNSMANIANPTAADSASVDRGRVLFQINCAVCHSAMAQGGGAVMKYEPAMAAPAINAGSRAAGYTDGYIFAIIRNGFARMPSYARIEESERWDIINYLRTLQGKGTIAADSSHGRPGETGRFVPGASVTAPTKPAPYFRSMTLPAAGRGAEPAEPAKAPATHDTTKGSGRSGGHRP